MTKRRSVQNDNMESKIIKLSNDLISKIAAGEVIERPASCIKELVENSIDAGATHISCEVKGNGVPEMRISDNGIGMSIQELELAVKPHTTSKLKDEEGLFKIMNFGFRGEALPSMCRVAELEISSRPKIQEVGRHIRVRNEEIIEKREAPRAPGTTITIRNLFYNMPVRRKFLKAETTELRYITYVIHRLALAYTDISFTFEHDGREILNLPQQEFSQRIAYLFGSDFLDTLAPINYETSGMHICGYVSKPYNFLATYHQLIFINKRPCRDSVVRRAMEQAYGVPLKEKTPSYIIFLDLPPNFIDVNVHPRKEEVRFKNESFVFNAVIKGVREGLGIKPFNQAQEKRRGEFELEGAKFWQFYDSYIFAQTEDGILILDQHAAHERIMYERLRREQVVPQKLLFPILVELTEIERKLLLEFKDSFEQLGFEIEEFGGTTFRITSIPSVLKNFTPELFKTMLLELSEYGNAGEDKIKEVVKVFACKSAIRAGDSLKDEEMDALVRQLFATENPYFCPHGRPTIIKITKEELERKFGK